MMRGRRRWRVLLALLVLGALASWLFPVLEVEGVSMWPTLRPRETLLVVRSPGGPSPQHDRWRMWVYRRSEGEAARVKRLLAFGGEWVDLRNGDLVVGPGPGRLRPVERPPEVLEEMLVRVYPKQRPRDQSWAARGGVLRVGRDGRHELQPGRGRASMELRLLAGPEDDPASNIHDDLPAGGGGPAPGPNVVSDVRIEVALDSLARGARFSIVHALAAGEELALEVAEDGLLLRARVPGGPLRAQRLAGEAPLPEAVRLETIDGRWTASVAEAGGWRALASGPRDTLAYGAASQVMLRVAGGSAVLGRVDIHRDVHYVWPPPLREMRLLPAGHCLLVGDNAPASRDARHEGAVPVRDLVGRVRARLLPWGRRAWWP